MRRKNVRLNEVYFICFINAHSVFLLCKAVKFEDIQTEDIIPFRFAFTRYIVIDSYKVISDCLAFKVRNVREIFK